MDPPPPRRPGAGYNETVAGGLPGLPKAMPPAGIAASSAQGLPRVPRRPEVNQAAVPAPTTLPSCSAPKQGA